MDPIKQININDSYNNVGFIYSNQQQEMEILATCLGAAWDA